MKNKCYCKDVEVGSYGNQKHFVPPSWSSKGVISVDACLSDEILCLWDDEIITTGCCCAHNRTDGVSAYIGVDESSEAKMLELGYKVAPNDLDKSRTDSFYPKTVGYYYITEGCEE